MSVNKRSGPKNLNKPLRGKSADCSSNKGTTSVFLLACFHEQIYKSNFSFYGHQHQT